MAQVSPKRLWIQGVQRLPRGRELSERTPAGDSATRQGFRPEFRN